MTEPEVPGTLEASSAIIAGLQTFLRWSEAEADRHLVEVHALTYARELLTRTTSIDAEAVDAFFRQQLGWAPDE